MPHLKRKCKGCGKENVYLSRKGYCEDCSMEKIKDNLKQLQKRKGSFYEAWKKGVLKFIGER